MKTVILALMLLLPVGTLFAQAFVQPPDIPATAPNPEFPLRVHILRDHWHYVRGNYQGWGRGNLLGDTPTGFDYTYTCDEPFLHNAQRDESYQARWKKQDKKIEILTQRVGSDHLHRCELRVALKPIPYGHPGATSKSVPAIAASSPQ